MRSYTYFVFFTIGRTYTRAFTHTSSTHTHPVHQSARHARQVMLRFPRCPCNANGFLDVVGGAHCATRAVSHKWAKKPGIVLCALCHDFVFLKNWPTPRQTHAKPTPNPRQTHAGARWLDAQYCLSFLSCGGRSFCMWNKRLPVHILLFATAPSLDQSQLHINTATHTRMLVHIVTLTRMHMLSSVIKHVLCCLIYASIGLYKYERCMEHYTYKHIYLHSCLYMYTYTYICIYIYTSIHILHMHTHSRKQNMIHTFGANACAYWLTKQLMYTYVHEAEDIFTHQIFAWPCSWLVLCTCTPD
jgi:hypothetical protein